MTDTFENLKSQIEKVARFESLVHMPEKKDPDWPVYIARATVKGHGTNGQGDTDIDALRDLLKKLQK